MLTTRHPFDFVYTRPELNTLFRYARDHDVERGEIERLRREEGEEPQQHPTNLGRTRPDYITPTRTIRAPDRRKRCATAPKCVTGAPRSLDERLVGPTALWGS